MFRCISIYISFVILFFAFIFLVGCPAKNLKYESQDIEREVKRKRIRIVFEDGFHIGLKYRIYFIDAVREYFLKSSEMVMVGDEDEYDLLAVTFISNVGHTINLIGGEHKVRLDFTANLSLLFTNGEYILSNQYFSYTFVTNIPPEVLDDPFRRELFSERIYKHFLDLTALNFVSLVSTGWKENYGYYSVEGGIFQRFLRGGVDDERTTKRTNQRNIPVVGGE